MLTLAQRHKTIHNSAGCAEVNGRSVFRAPQRGGGGPACGVRNGLYVAEDNPHSLDAHVNGLGMTRIGQFAPGGKRYDILAFEGGR